MSTPLLVTLAAAPEVMVVARRPSRVQAPEVQAVTVGAAAEKLLIFFAPAPEVLTVGLAMNPLVEVTSDVLVAPSVKVPLTRLAVPAEVWMNEVSVNEAASVVALVLVTEWTPELWVKPVTPDKAPALMLSPLILPLVGAEMDPADEMVPLPVVVMLPGVVMLPLVSVRPVRLPSVPAMVELPVMAIPPVP